MTTDTLFKSKSLAVKGAHEKLGAEAIEGLDFLVRNTGAGWEIEELASADKAEDPKPQPVSEPPAARVDNDPHPLLQPGQNVDPALVVEGRVYGNKTRAAEARRAKAESANRAADAPARAPRPKSTKAEKPKAQKAKRGTAALDEALGKREANLEAAVAKAPKADKPKPAKAAPKPAKPKPEGPTKLDQIVTLMQRPQGATVEEMTTATSWLPHSLRAVISTRVKRDLGLEVAVKRTDGITVYTIVQKAPAEEAV